MDWLEFIAAIIGHIAWPVVILILLLMLRRHIGELAERLLEFSFGGAKVTFDKILRTGAEIIQEAPVPQLPKPVEEPQLPLQPPALPDKTRQEIALKFQNRRRARKARLNSSNFGKVISGLEEVDNLLFEIGDASGIDAADASSVMYHLISRKRIPESIGQLYQTLRDARNLLAHSPTLPDEREAMEYVRQTNYLRTILEMLRNASDPKTDKSEDEQ
jgi:hypothetical protein